MRYAYIYALAALLAACGAQKNTPAQEEESKAADTEIALTKAQAQVAELQVGPMGRHSLSKEVRCTGRLEVPPQQVASVHAPLQGAVTFVDGQEGQQVRKGQVLARIEHMGIISMQEQYLQTKGELAYQQKEYERQRQLSEKDATSRKVLEKAQADLSVLRARKTSLEAQLRLLGISPSDIREDAFVPDVSIRAPFDGYISKINIARGQYVGIETEMFELIDKNHLHAELEVFEKELPLLRTGQPIRFSISGDSTPFGGKIYLLGQKVDPETKTLLVHCDIDKQEHPALKVGMALTATIFTAAAEVPALPESALVREGNQYYAFIETSPLHYRRVSVQVGKRSEGYAEVLGTEAPQDARFVLKGANYLVE